MCNVISAWRVDLLCRGGYGAILLLDYHRQAGKNAHSEYDSHNM